MKTFLLFLTTLITVQVNAQNAYFTGVDSVNNIEWKKELPVGSVGINPSDYTLYEYSLIKNDRIILLTCGNLQRSSVYTSGIPESCFKMEAMSGNVTYIGERPPNRPKLDSMPVVDQDCLTEYYNNPPDSSIIDTIYIGDDIDLDALQSSDYDQITQRQYKNGVAHGVETGRYTPTELNGVCVKQNFQLKYTGKWKAGKKHGKWLWYNKEGFLVKIEVYKKDKLVKEKDVS
jgi:hypothetical protein